MTEQLGNGSGLFVMHANIRSFNENINELEVYLGIASITMRAILMKQRWRSNVYK